MKKTCKCCGNLHQNPTSNKCWRCKEQGKIYRKWRATSVKTGEVVERDKQLELCQQLGMFQGGFDKYRKKGYLINKEWRVEVVEV